MTDSDTEGRWITTFAADTRPGDLLRTGRHERRLVARDFPDAASPSFRAVYSHGGFDRLTKTELVEIYDEDGAVSARIAAIARGAL